MHMTDSVVGATYQVARNPILLKSDDMACRPYAEPIG